jgi:hypothetical protein
LLHRAERTKNNLGSLILCQLALALLCVGHPRNLEDLMGAIKIGKIGKIVKIG